jgi:Arc/MetJ-type ribon-helix-helix transcriptional regulator
MKNVAKKDKWGTRGISLPQALDDAVATRIAQASPQYSNFSHYVRCLIEADLKKVADNQSTEPAAK